VCNVRRTVVLLGCGQRRRKEEGRGEMTKPKKEYKTKMPIGDIVTCPKGHSETYLVMEEAVLKERGLVLGCEVCEEWFTFTT